MKPLFRKHLIVFLDDQALPTGFDIITACQLGKSKAGVHDQILYLGKPLAYYSDESIFVTKWLSIVILVTRDRVLQETLKTCDHASLHKGLPFRLSRMALTLMMSLTPIIPAMGPLVRVRHSVLYLSHAPNHFHFLGLVTIGVRMR